jgi:hypothetical protein
MARSKQKSKAAGGNRPETKQERRERIQKQAQAREVSQCE